MKSLNITVGAIRCAILVSLALGFSQASRADNCSGYAAEVNKSHEQIELSTGNVMSSFTGYDIVTSDDDPNSNGEMGECYGSWLATSDGKSRGAGFCAFKDKDGDTEYVQWEANATEGTWKDVGGTGKWAGKRNSGWTKVVARDDKRTLLRWGGTCEQ